MKMKTMGASLLAMLTLGAIAPTTTVPIVAADTIELPTVYDGNDVYIDLTQEDFYKIELIAKLNDTFQLSADNKLSLTMPLHELQLNYNLSDYDVSIIKQTLDYHNSLSLVDYDSEYVTFLHVKDWHIYLNHGDVMQLGNMIIGLGPAAVAATFSAFMSAVPGAGTIAGAVIGYFGAATIVGNVAYAAATGRGLKIGLTGISTY